MGNEISKYSDTTSIDKYDKMALQVDLIANKIILKEVKQNSVLSDSGRCSQLIIITSEILKRLPFKVISFMNRRRKTFGNDYENYAASEKVLLLDTHSSSIRENEMDERDSYKKNQMCIGIARFYVQVGNLFNAIMSTIKPFDYSGGSSSSSAPYNYCDLLANSLFEKDNFDKYVSGNLHQYMKKQRDMNTKLNRLKRTNNNDDERLLPSVCSVYSKIKGLGSSSSSSSSSSRKNSIFSSLDKLYLDMFHEKTYANNKAEFIEMSTKMMEEIYLPDVRALHKMVTGREASQEIRSFGDIPFDINSSILRDVCESKDKYNPNENGSKRTKNVEAAIIVDDTLRTNQYFENYITHIKKMITKTNNQRAELIALLNKVFVMTKKTDIEIRRMQDEYGKTSKKMDGYDDYRMGSGSDTNNNYSRHLQKYGMIHNFFIHPQLTDSMLQEIINDARVKIVRMYVSCQENFVEGVKLLDALHTNAQLRFDSSSQHLASDRQGDAYGYGARNTGNTQKSSEEYIDYIKMNIGNNRAGISFNKLIYKFETAINSAVGKKQIRLMMEKDKAVEKTYRYIEQIKSMNKNLNDTATMQRIELLIEDYKTQLNAIVKEGVS
jgi:hypothetical protein